MKILHLSTGDLNGGAFRGSYWLHQGLLASGIDSQLLVRDKSTNDSTVIRTPKSFPVRQFDRVKNKISNLPLHFYKDRKSIVFSPGLSSSSGVLESVRKIHPDIIHLHWVSGGFLNPEILKKFNVPIVWTLRDMWSFTGGCHYSFGCTAYREMCGNCYVLNSSCDQDLSRKIWKGKQSDWQNLDIRLVAISSWLAQCANESSLFSNNRVDVIHNALDESLFFPVEKTKAKKILGLPVDKKVILFGAINALDNPIKGFQYLVQALKKLALTKLRETTEIVIFGSDRPAQELDLGFNVTYLGRLNDDSKLTLAYSAADVMIVPSVQEAFGKTAIESMSCKTPVVSFDSTGLKDIVEHKKSGYRAICFDTDDLSYGIQWVLEDDMRHSNLCEYSRVLVEKKFTLRQQTESYINIYNDVYGGS